MTRTLPFRVSVSRTDLEPHVRLILREEKAVLHQATAARST